MAAVYPPLAFATMCGRFVAASSPDDIANYFDAQAPEALLEPNYNVAPTHDVYAVRADGGVRRVEAFHWGLVPSWAKDPKVGSRMINARSETLASKGAFKPSFTKRRVLIPADGFYEWKRPPAGLPKKTPKQPFFIHRPDGEPLAFAGLWAVWKGPSEGDRLQSTTIITTEANETMAPLHDRMPVILPQSAWDQWLDPENHDIETLGKLLVPAPPELIITHPVSTEVNNVRNRGPHLIDQVEPDTLFD
jgi:putative SOS response-associated peptidase YedK